MSTYIFRIFTTARSLNVHQPVLNIRLTMDERVWDGEMHNYRHFGTLHIWKLIKVHLYAVLLEAKQGPVSFCLFMPPDLAL